MVCGIAGRICNAPTRVGRDLVDLMAAQAHRGADSTGFAIYAPPRERGFVLRAMGHDRTQHDQDLAALRDILHEFGSDFDCDPSLDDSAVAHYSLRVETGEISDVPRFTASVDRFCKGLELQSLGRSLEIIKDTGNAREVAEKHLVDAMVGTHGLGHARLATESDVRPTASHPFWARPFPDVAIVHNGQLTNYFSWRARLQRAGYRFLTENDSELIAVWISDRMRAGVGLEAALAQSISDLDGVFTYMISLPDRIGWAKDRFAMKPLVVAGENGEIAAATEEQAVRRIYPGEDHAVINHDGPARFGSWGVGNRAAAA